MDMEWLTDNAFRFTRPFTINKLSWHGEQDCIQITNDLMESLKCQGIELHYEVQLDKDKNECVIRLDCHAFPYGKFKNAKNYELALKEYYSDAVAASILEKRKKLKAKFLSFNDSKKKDFEYGKNNNQDYLRLVYKTIPYATNEIMLVEIYRFIVDTYPELIDILKSIDLL